MTNHIQSVPLRPLRELVIDGQRIGEQHPTYCIADVAANHDGDLERAKDLIYMAK
jgi:sialic acid synthase SpsE